MKNQKSQYEPLRMYIDSIYLETREGLGGHASGKRGSERRRLPPCSIKWILLSDLNQSDRLMVFVTRSGRFCMEFDHSTCSAEAIGQKT